MEVIILAGGFGTRLRSVVNEVPKCMAPIANKPFLWYLLKYLTKFDVSKEQDGSVIAWVDENSTMYIGGRGGIIADQSLNTMFSYYTSVKEVIFKKVLNTKDSISARNMFLSCENLKTT